MRNALLLSLATLAGGSAANASTMDILAADRELFVIACGFDYEFNDCAGARESSSALSGFYDNQIIADLDDYYGNDVSDADGIIYSNITDQRIELEYFGVAGIDAPGIYQADASVAGDTDIEFEVLDDVRVVFEGYAEGYEGYVVASASLREVGGSSIAGFGVQGPGDDEVRYVGWLYAGTYAVSANFDCGVYGGGQTVQVAAGELSLSFRIYDKADFDVNGSVNRDDRRAFIADYRARLMSADFNGDGVVNSSDRSMYLAAWNAAQGK